MHKIAVIGSGISGLSCAYRLTQAGYAVTLFEANDYFGGHTHTVDVTLDGITHGVDTGFLVFNDRTYPNLIALFEELDVPSVATDMSFSVKLAAAQRTLEWAGSSLDTVFAQRRNVLDKQFLGMLRDIVRFNRQANAFGFADTPSYHYMPLEEFLAREGYGEAFRNWYLLPMAACIWSCPAGQMLKFPVATFVRFCQNHGLLQIFGRPQWRTVPGGARQYVEKILSTLTDKRLHTPVQAVMRRAGHVAIKTATGIEMFDQIVLASHSDDSLLLLQDATADEHDILSSIKYQPNTAVLHTDADCLPSNRKAWSAWNYQSSGGMEPKVCVHYLLNRLQPLPFDQPLIVSLNPIEPLRSEKVIASFDYAHPVFDAAAIDAQQRLTRIQGMNNTWFAGAWTGYGFHEDGLRSGLAVAKAIGRKVEMAETLKAVA